MERFPGLEQGSLDAFLNFLYDGLSGYVIVGELQTNGEKQWVEHSPYRWPQDRDAIRSHIVFSSKTTDVYITPAVFKAPAATKDAFHASNVAWAEFDVAPATPTLSNLPSEPSVRIESSPGRFHQYYLLDSTITDATALEAANRSLAYGLGADKSGWNANKLLRPVRSVNYKYDTPFVVNLVACGTATFDPAILAAGYEPPKQTEAFVPEVLIPVTDIILKYPFNDNARDLMKTKKLVEGHDWSGALVSLAYSLAEMGLSNTEIFSVLKHKDAQWVVYSHRADQHRRLAEIVQIAKDKYPNGVEEDQTEPVQPGADFLVLGWRSLKEYVVNYEWVVEDMHLKDTMNVVAGKAGVGKTQLSLRFAQALALGRTEYLGYKIPRQRKVLFLSLELGVGGIKFFQDTMGPSLTSDEVDVLEDQLIMVPVGNTVNLASEWGQAAVNYLIEQYEPDVLMTDSMGSSVGGSLAKSELTHELLAYNDRLNARGISTWFISHPRKWEVSQSARKRPTLDDLFGDVFIGNRARGVFALYDTNKEDKLELITLKQTFTKEHKSKFLLRDEHLDFHLTDPPAVKQKSGDTAGATLTEHYGAQPQAVPHNEDAKTI